MNCPHCHAPLSDPPPSVCPACFEDPATAATPVAPVGDSGSPGQDPGFIGGPSTPAPAAHPCVTEGCGGTAVAPAELCLTCQLMTAPTGRTYILTSSWGDLEVREGERITLGRSPEAAPRTAAFLINADRVSRLHADLSNLGGTLTLVDNSTNGTQVNGHRLEPGNPKTLLVGDRVVLGTQVEFVVDASD